MRILHVRFRNLNSLAGEWEIDFSHPAFVAESIFAITGPTGAGKTTILDAICLALYGRTPRLNKVSRSSNEIMSRQTGDCFAEVTFETDSGRYRCHWSQHRGRKKPDGELQPAKHEIANADSGEIFESKIRGVAEQIEAATGMDFDQFTRSMMLAQGGFAAFLQAAADERAPILEQITGTEIYSRISMRVHNRYAEERKRLDMLQAEVAGIQLLSEEEEQQLAGSLELKHQQESELADQLTLKNQAVAWIEGISRLHDELRALGEKKSALRARIAAFAPQQERLRLAIQALELSADYAALTAIRKAQDADRGSLIESRNLLPACTDALRQAEEATATASGELAQHKLAQQAALPVIRKVRELDLKITGNDASLSAAYVAVAEFSTALGALQIKQESDSGELKKQRKAFDELQALLAASPADEELVEYLSGLRNRFDSLKALAGQLTGKVEETSKAEARLRQELNVWQEQASSLEGERDDLKRIRDLLAEKESERLTILDGKDVPAWRKCQSVLMDHKVLIAETVDAVESLATSQQAVRQLKSRQIVLQQEETTLSGTLASQSEKQEALEKEVGLLETQLILLKRIEDMEGARRKLQDGEPCPLCGAEKHPYAAGNIPVPDETQERLALVRGELKVVIRNRSDLNVRMAEVSRDSEQSATAEKEYAAKIEEAARVISDNCHELNIDGKLAISDPEFPEKLRQLQEKNARQCLFATAVLERVDSIDREMTALRDTIENARESVAKREHDTQAALHRKESAGQLLERLSREVAGYREQQEQSLAMLREEVGRYGVTTLSLESIDTVYNQLLLRRDQRVLRNRQKTDCEQRIAVLEQQIQHHSERILKAEDDRRKQQELLTGFLCERDTFQRERLELFGEKKADDEEQLLSDAIESADKVLDGARQKLSAAHQELSRLHAGIDALERATDARDLQLTLAVDAFNVRLNASGFSDEEQYQASCLPEVERRELAEYAQKLSDEGTETASREREKHQMLAAEQEKSITSEPVDDLRNSIAMLAVARSELQQEIGGIRQKLGDNKRLKEQQQERFRAIEAQKREYARWHLLYELIGSADGKKYRNFAQGLTFEIMIGYANQQLLKMSDRYLLVRDDAQPLELNVIDNYQAGEKRSTKNLSGGESFIISLSLALGLSQMASKNVRVDSLFLDEGFGTLDEEALDTALQTLAGLQQEGKLIGIISHVPALRERISTRIKVTPGSGGKSLISGPGCRRVGAFM